MNKKSLNRIKVVLAVKGRTNKWLSGKIKKTPVTISKWCSNTSQPSLETLDEIAKALEVDIRDLINPTVH